MSNFRVNHVFHLSKSIYTYYIFNVSIFDRKNVADEIEQQFSTSPNRSLYLNILQYYYKMITDRYGIRCVGTLQPLFYGVVTGDAPHVII